MKRLLVLAAPLLVLALAFAACGDGGSDEPEATSGGTPSAIGTAAPTDAPGVVIEITPGVAPTGSDPEDEPGPTLDPETPAGRVAQTLVADEGVDPRRIEVLSLAPIAWPDACLGLGRPNEACAQVATAGFRIVLLVENVRYIYRTNEPGTDIRLEKIDDLSDIAEGDLQDEG